MIWVFEVPSPASNSSYLLEWVKALGPVVGAIIAVVGVCLTIWFSIRKGRVDARYDYAVKALDLRLHQLSDFYAPLRLHIEQSRILYKKLLWSLERLGKSNSEARIDLDGFRLLDHVYTILQDDKFVEVRPLVQSILEIGDSIGEIIAKNAGLAEGGITNTFIEYRAHREMLKAAATQPPTQNDNAGWQQFGYYPRMLNREITEGYKEVLRHFEVFQEAGDEIVWTLLGRLPESRRKAFRELLDNLTYYERNVDAYAAKYDGFDLSELRSLLQKAVTEVPSDQNSVPNGLVKKLLDVGCGTGRDTAAFIRSGFEVTAFDISPAMVRRCRRRIRELKSSADTEEASRANKSICEELAFDELRYRNEFDAVWASAALLHVSKREFPVILQSLVQSLKPHGVLFMSFKYGMGEAEFDSRHYSYFRRGELQKIVKNIPHANIRDIWLTNSMGVRLSRPSSLLASLRIAFKQSSNSWVNVLVTKSLR